MSKNEELCIKNEELCIKNEELCIENEELCIKNEELCSDLEYSGVGLGAFPIFRILIDFLFLES